MKDWVRRLRRVPAARKTAVKSRKATAELSQEMRDYAATHPKASNQEIGDFFGVNTGRVSEALNFLR